MKIIICDNFDRDEVADQVLCENVSEHWGKRIVEFLNSKYSHDSLSNLFFKLVPDGHKLKECGLP